MKIKQAKFLKSAPALCDCVESQLSEFALIGRSNVGKSSFINVISNNNKLAKTSNKPGKTKLINLYEFNNNFIIADLPGYGFANVSYNVQNIWEKNLSQYLLKRENLKLLIQFIDSRHTIQKNDKIMNNWIEYNNLKSESARLVKEGKLTQMLDFSLNGNGKISAGTYYYDFLPNTETDFIRYREGVNSKSKELNNINIPVLVVFGDMDECVLTQDIEIVKGYLKNNIKECNIQIIKGADHSFTDKYEELGEIIEKNI